MGTLSTLERESTLSATNVTSVDTGYGIFQKCDLENHMKIHSSNIKPKMNDLEFRRVTMLISRFYLLHPNFSCSNFCGAVTM